VIRNKGFPSQFGFVSIKISRLLLSLSQCEKASRIDSDSVVIIAWRENKKIRIGTKPNNYSIMYIMTANTLAAKSTARKDLCNFRFHFDYGHAALTVTAEGAAVLCNNMQPAYKRSTCPEARGGTHGKENYSFLLLLEHESQSS
jgi:hypothetical protein